MATMAKPGTTTEAVRHEASARIRRFRLVITAGAAGTPFTSAGPRTVIGSDPSAGVVLADPAVSRFHCEIALIAGRCELRDLGSTNGTVVNGVPVVQAFLLGGETLTLGRTQLRFELGADHIEVPLSEREAFGLLVGRSPAMRAAFALLERAAASDATVLLLGETGTGKDAAAESIHRESSRRDGPFLVVDCGAVPHDLLESELFGHDRGAFTGATSARAGAFEAAAGGTVFLDEIGELAPDLQPKLLRVLDRREVKRLGTTEVLPVDVRLIVATNRDLRAEVNARRFRADLYYRLAVLEVALPSLRERAEDLPLLVANLLDRMGAAGRPEAARLGEPERLAELSRHAWPGNVRELRNHIERCLAFPFAEAAFPVSAQDPPAIDLGRPFREARDAFERRYLAAALERTQGNVAAAARASGLDRLTFYRLLWRRGLR